MRSLRALVALLLLLIGTAGSALAVSTAADLCGANADPCTVGRNLKADDGSTFDLGGRALVLESGGRLDVGTGSMTIIAKSLRLKPNSRLVGRGGRVTVTTSGGIELNGNSRIDVSDTVSLGDFPGRIRLQGGGDVVIEGLLDASAAAKSDGGVVEVTGATVTIGVNGRINVSGGGLSGGGIVGLSAQGALGIAGPIDAPGGDSGGAIEIDAGSVATSARLDVSGGPQGSGAVIEILARGNVVIGGVISGEVDPPGQVFGSAADVSIVTSGNVELNDAIILTGGVPAGEGGTLDVDADGDVTQRGAITVAGRGTGGVGGEVRLAANGALTLGDIDVAGATAGTLTTLSVAGTHLTGTLNADSSQEAIGTAGTIEVAACALDMDSLAVISSAGLGGTNRVRAGAQMVLRGTLFAGESNSIEYQDAALAPVVSGTVTPAATPAVNTGLGLCSIPGGGTTTTTLPGGCGTLSDFDGLLCRLAAITATLVQTPDDALGGKKTAKKIKKKVSQATSLTEGARDATKAKKRVKKLRGAGKQLAGFLKIVRKGQDKGKIDAALAGTLTGLGDAAATQIDQLRTTTP
jgi:hypothetical protein